MAVQAKVRCTTNAGAKDEEYKIVRFFAVYSDDPENENSTWSKATPSGYIELYITNPDAYNEFKINEEYIVTFQNAV